MNKHNREIQSYTWLIGWLFFAFAWLAGALAPTMSQSWNHRALLYLTITSLCWGVYGWYYGRAAQPTLENSAFTCALGALLPWIGFTILMIAPYALGVRQTM